ncbi:MAG TPA: hypothetical protein VFE08_13840, partial [Candidatus Sulfotelmatobacter sp.]|nr:hypothetical protein [Candidatus Sulfotelmatobacter sp.]
RQKSSGILFLALDANLQTRQPNSEPDAATDELSVGKPWEASTGLVLFSTHQGPFIPWALYAVERAFSKSLQDEAEYNDNRSDS